MGQFSVLRLDAIPTPVLRGGKVDVAALKVLRAIRSKSRECPSQEPDLVDITQPDVGSALFHYF